MAKPLTLFTCRAADAIRQLLNKAVPAQPILSSDNDQNLIKLNDMMDALNDDIEDLTECFQDLKKSTEKWCSMIQRATVAEKPTLEQQYIKISAEIQLEDCLEQSGERLRVLKDMDRRLKNLKRREERAKISVQTANCQKIGANSGFKLPKMEVPKFSGKKCDWPEWWQIFKATVHDSAATAELKHAMLKQLVEGKSKPIIAGLQLSDYDLAIDLLKRNYDNAEQHIRLLFFELQSLKQCYSFTDVRNFCFEAKKLYLLLEHYGQKMSGPGIWMQLEQKLTVSALREVLPKKELNKSTGLAWDTAKFLNALQVVEKEEKVLCIHRSKTETLAERK